MAADPPQSIVVLSAEVADLACVTVVARLGAETGIPWREALLHNGALLGAALMLRDGTYLLRLSVPLDALALEGFDAVLTSVAVEASRLRARMRLPAIDIGGFAWAL
jgi:hypothetical protein